MATKFWYEVHNSLTDEVFYEDWSKHNLDYEKDDIDLMNEQFKKAICCNWPEILKKEQKESVKISLVEINGEYMNNNEVDYSNLFQKEIKSVIVDSKKEIYIVGADTKLSNEFQEKLNEYLLKTSKNISIEFSDDCTIKTIKLKRNTTLDYELLKFERRSYINDYFNDETTYIIEIFDKEAIDNLVSFDYKINRIEKI